MKERNRYIYIEREGKRKRENVMVRKLSLVPTYFQPSLPGVPILQNMVLT